MLDHKAHWLTRLQKKIQSLFFGEPKNQNDLIELLTQAQSRSLINADTLHQIRAIIEFSSSTVSDVMLPRGQMITLDADASIAQALPLIMSSAHSRFPVLSENHNEVLGVLLAKDILPILIENKAETTWVSSIMRTPIFVPETKRLDALLNEFKSKHAHMAIVVDEYGAIAGLMTIEDILEEIVGDIIDETDPEKEKQIITLDDNTYSVDALIMIEDFNAFFKTQCSDEYHDTLAGLICQKTGTLPSLNEVIIFDGFVCEITGRDERRLTKVKVTVLDKKNNDPS
jgi:magnesium and cobalt transporter